MLSKTKQNKTQTKKRCDFPLIYTVIDFHFNPLGRLLVVKLEIGGCRVQGYQHICGDPVSWGGGSGRNRYCLRCPLSLRAVECPEWCGYWSHRWGIQEFLKNYLLTLILCVWVLCLNVYMCVPLACRRLWRSEEDLLRIRVTDGFELLCGDGNWTLVLCKSHKYS